MKTMKKCLSVFLSVLMLFAVCAVSVSAACSHRYESTFSEATCIEAAYYQYVCSLCGDSYRDTIGTQPALGHTFGEWYVVDTADCLYEGHEKRDCSVCDGSEIKTHPVLGHADENSNGKCDRCNEPMEKETVFAPFDWILAFFRAIAQWFKDIFA